VWSGRARSSANQARAALPSAKTGRDVSPAAVYIALRRLEDKGLLVSELRTARPEEGGRERRYYRITTEGLARMSEARDALMNLWDGLELRFEEGT